MIKLSIYNGENEILRTTSDLERAMLVYENEYAEGDYIELICSEKGFYEIRLEDTLPPTIVYIKDKVIFNLPYRNEQKSGYSPRSFVGTQHLITANIAEQDHVRVRRNLAYNPHDQRSIQGMYPHATANVETRNETLFEARNVIDGIFTNENHYPYPYHSWGINQNPKAELTVDFGRAVNIDSIVLTLRADFPHDSFWTKATLEFSDGTLEVVDLVKTERRQIFKITKNEVTWLKLKDMIKNEDESPFPALTQIEAWGKIII